MSSADAITAVISGEDAAAYAYGVIGGQSTGRWPALARKARSKHLAARQSWQSQLQQPVSAPPAFDLPFAVADTESARRLAVLVEQRLAGLYADLAAAVEQEQRDAAVGSAMECATRAIVWGGSPQAFPHG